VRVDHGTEFCPCIFVQELLKNRRHDNSRAPWRQTTSTKNYRAERLWPEENSRVNYPLKKALCIIKEQEIFNMEDPMVSFAVSWLTINVSKVGSENFVNSWNHHRIPGPKGCIPIEKMRGTNQAVPLEPHLIPTTPEAVRMYEERGGRLNTDPSIGYDPIACYDHLQESREHLFLSRNSSFASIFCDVVHDRIDTFVTAIKSFIAITEFLAQTEATS